MQTQSSPAEQTGGGASIGAPQDLYLFTSVVQGTDGYTVGYANSAGTHALSWISLVRADGSRATWEHALVPSGTVTLRAAPLTDDSLHFHVNKPGLPGADWEVMSAWAKEGARDAESAPEPGPVTGPEPTPDSPPAAETAAPPASPSGWHPDDEAERSAGVRCYQWFHIDAVERVRDKYVVQYSREFGDFPADNCYIALFDGRGNRLSWEWARGKSGASAVEYQDGGTHLVYFACHVLVDPYKTAIPVHRWNL